MNPRAHKRNPNVDDEADVDIFGADSDTGVSGVDLDDEDEISDLDQLDDAEGISDDEGAVDGQSVSDEDDLEGEDDGDAAGLIDQIEDLLSQLAAIAGVEGDDEVGADELGQEDGDEFSDEGDDDVEVEFRNDEDEDMFGESADPSSWDGKMQTLNAPAGQDGAQVAPENSAKKATKLPKRAVSTGADKFVTTADSVNSVKAAGNKTTKYSLPQAKAILGLVQRYMNQNNKLVDASFKGKNVKLKAMEAIEIDLSDEVAALHEIDETLSPEFLAAATEIFEAAVAAKINLIAEDIEVQFSLALSEEIEHQEEALISRVDEYLDYVTENYFEENKIAIREGAATQLSDSFVAGIRQVFTEHHVEVPEGKIDMVEQLEATVAAKDEKIKKVTRQALAIRKENVELKRNQIISEASFDLSVNQTSKLQKLAESVDYTDNAEFEVSINRLKETHFGNGNTKTSKAPSDPLVENLNEGNGDQDLSSSMSGYLKAMQITRDRNLS